MEACQSDQTDHDETASGHQKGHLAACRRGPVEGAEERGSVLEHGPSPVLPYASSRSGPSEEAAAGSAQMEGHSVDHETAASWGNLGSGHGSNSDLVLRVGLSSEGTRVPPTAPSPSDAWIQGKHSSFDAHLEG